MNIGSFVNNLKELNTTEFITDTGLITDKKPKNFRTIGIINASRKALNTMTADQARKLGTGIETYQKRVVETIHKKWGCFLFLRDLFAIIGSLFGVKSIQKEFALLLKEIENTIARPSLLPIPATPPASPRGTGGMMRTAAVPRMASTAVAKEPATAAVLATYSAASTERMSYDDACALIICAYHAPAPSDMTHIPEAMDFLDRLLAKKFATLPPINSTLSYADVWSRRLLHASFSEPLDKFFEEEAPLRVIAKLPRINPADFPPFQRELIIEIGHEIEKFLSTNAEAKGLTSLSPMYPIKSIPKNFSTLYPAVTKLKIECNEGAKIQLRSPTITELIITGDLRTAPDLDLPELTHLKLSAHIPTPILDKCPKIK